MFVIDRHAISDARQRSVYGIEERVCILIVLRSNPFPFHNSPKSLCDIQLRRIRRQEEEEKATLFPYGAEILYLLASVHTRIVKHDESLPADTERKCIQELQHLVRSHLLKGGESLIVVVPVNHAENVHTGYSLGWNIDIFRKELPSIWHIAFRTDMTLISIIKTDAAFFILIFKFLQLFDLVLVELRRGLSPWAFSYTLISCANADKKRLNVITLASLPVAFCQASLAAFTLCLSCSIAARTASSSVESIMGLRPRPGRVCKPCTPSDLNRRSHAFTDTRLMSVCLPTSSEDNPSAFKSIARQRIRKQCFSPLRNPFSSSRRSASVNSNTFAFAIYSIETETNRIYFIQTNIVHLLIKRKRRN